MLLLLPSYRGSSFEIHYWFADKSHNMDAIVQNKCESEILALIRALAANFGEEIQIETEAIGEGGLRRWFKIITKTEDKKAILTTAILTSLLTAIIVTPIGTALNKTAELTIESIFEDKEEKSLDKEKKRAEIENIKADTKLKEQQIEKNTTILRRRSNFYELLQKYPKVEKLSVVIQDENKLAQSEEFEVRRNEFLKYILETDELEPKQIDNAIIEIISPVLKKGNYKWRGVYDGQSYSFNMKSNEFKQLVQTGEIEFKNGTTIKCLLEVKSRINTEGDEEIKELNILRVDEYFDNNKPIETPEGKKRKRRKNNDQQQLSLF